MKILPDETKCTGCGLCAQICPVDCISMQPGEGGFLYPQKDMTKCIGCDKCLRECPVMQPRKPITPLECYAFQQTDTDSRMKSASGGAADAFAKAVLSKGGVYTGVKWDEKMQAVHGACTEEDQLDLFRDSKYVQSNPADIFSQIKAALEAGKQVLATGTPCQIAGIRGYLKKDYENLILCDLICHGVPSPAVFQKYLQSLEEKTGKKIKEFYFRDKTHGWRKSNVRVVYDDGSQQILTRKECDYFRLFGSNIIFRKNCHHCQFRNFMTSADLTIGDFWGIEKRYPEFTDDLGCSVVIVNTEKGRRFFDDVKAGNQVLQTDLDFVVETHAKLKNSIPESPYRGLFMKILGSDGSGYQKAAKNFLNKSYYYRIKRVLWKGLSRK